MRAASAREKMILRLAACGESVIDQPTLDTTTPEAVAHFLKINEYHLGEVKDRDRLLGVHNEAVGYLKNQLQLELPASLAKPDRIQDLFLIASDFTDRELQSSACMVLKAMNIINHIDGRELLYHCPISTRDLYSLVEDKIERKLSSLAKKELPNLRYAGGRKSKESLITKLIAKRETIAAQINDRLRYRIITPTRADIPTVIFHLFDSILPYNYVIPNASVNQLLDEKEILGWQRGASWSLHRLLKRFSDLMPYPPRETHYTGSTYRVLRFVVDVPVKLDRFLGASQRLFHTETLGSIAYVLVEFQVVDEATDRLNQSGENAHPLYKTRQKSGVARRLQGR